MADYKKLQSQHQEDQLRISNLIARNLELETMNVDLVDALKPLSLSAQLTGGVAGRDEHLCAAIDVATEALRKAGVQS